MRVFFWRKKAEGFDWHAYVRTTIKLRREHRRARLEDIGRVAAEQAKAVGGAAVQGVADAANSGSRATAAAWRATLAKPAVALPVALCGLMALLSGAYRWSTIAADAQALLPLGLGLVVLVLLVPLVVPIAVSRPVKGFRPLSFRMSQTAVSYMAVAGAALLLGWFAWGRGGMEAVGVSGGIVSGTEGAATVLDGRATVLSGEMIRLQGRLLHLSGIEAPDQLQTCMRATKQTWRCGEAAFAALDRLARAKPFRCVTQGGPNTQGRTEASCTIDGRDVAGELVKEGHVFATASFFGGYSSLESSARRAAQGVWSGDVERPNEFRSKAWAAAKAKAPDGCPIKGRISSNRKTYLMPWTPGYSETTVRANRGERWFCDEAEAQNAGFSSSPIGRQVSK